MLIPSKDVIAAVSGCVLGSLVALLAVPKAAPTVSAPTQVANGSAPAVRWFDQGRADAIDALIEIESVDSSSGSDELLLRPVVRNQMEGTGRIASKLVVFDTAGNVVGEDNEWLNLVQASNEISTPVTPVPAGLDDGFYRAELLVAWQPAKGFEGVVEPGTTSRDMYLKVENGTVSQVDFDDYYYLSDAHVATTEP